MSTETFTINSDMFLSTLPTISASAATKMSSLNTETDHAGPFDHDSMVIWFHDENLDFYIQCVIRMKLFEMFKCVRIITDEQKFITYLTREFIVTTLKFIISGEPAERLCSLVESKSKNYQVYELDFGRPQLIMRKSNTWSIFNNIEKLFKTIYEDLNKKNVTVDKNKKIADEDEYKYGNFLPPIGIFNSPSISKLFHSLDKESSTFILFQLLNKIIIEMGYNAEDLDKMYLFCRQHFLSDLAHLDEIDEFWETYSEENAICEYTKDSFVFRLLSKIFRNEDTDGIYNFRCYIKDLCKQLDLLSEKQKKSMLPENEIILYRGKKLPLIVLQQLKELYDSEDVKDKLISINGFLSTTRNQEIANIHAGFDGKRDGYESVLFILKIDREMITAVSYASISHISCFPQEEEFLFSMGSVWQLMNMVCIDAKLTIELKLSNLFDTSIANLPKELSVDQSSNNCYLFLFAKILHKLGKYSQAVEHYNELLLNELSNKFKRLIHLNLATIRNELGLYTDAQKHLDEILYLDKSNAKSTNETSSSSLQSIYAIATMPSRLIILNNMGVLYQKKNETQKARNSFEEALKEQGTLIETSMVYNNLGNLENICRNIKKAHPYLEKAAKLAENSVWSHKFKQDLENVERQLKKNKLKNQNGTNLSPNEVNFS